MGDNLDLVDDDDSSAVDSRVDTCAGAVVDRGMHIREEEEVHAHVVVLQQVDGQDEWNVHVQLQADAKKVHEDREDSRDNVHKDMGSGLDNVNKDMGAKDVD